MTGRLDDTSAAEVEKDIVRPILLAFFDFISAPTWLWSGVGDLTWNSYTWKGIGQFGRVTQIEETVELRAAGMTLELSGVNSENIVDIVSEPIQGQRAQLYLGFLDENFALIADPVLMFDGRMDTIDQIADQVLIDNSNGLWTNAHRLRGLAYIHGMLRWDQTAYAGGLPNISAVVKGRKVYDPRTETTAWSANPALCILDYITADFGLSATYAEIDMDSFIAAANICDESVDTIDSSESRYTCNGVVDLGDDPQTTLQNMLTSCAGTITCVGGKWRIRVGAWSPAVYTLEPRHARDAVTFRPYRSHKDLINAVIGAFTSPDNQWQQTDYPEVSVNSYIAQDGGDYASTTLDLPFTISPTMAQRIARIALEQNRRQRAVTFPANLAGFCVAAGDNVAIDLPRFGFSGLICTVGGWQMSDDFGVDLDLTEDDEDVYAFSSSDLQALNH